jgi:hypothetical protein
VLHSLTFLADFETASAFYLVVITTHGSVGHILGRIPELGSLTQLLKKLAS